MFHKLPYACRLCKNFLEEGNFTYAIDKRDGNPILFCNPCGEDGKKFGNKEITEEEFRESVKKRSEEGELKIKQKIEEAKKQEEEKKKLQHSSLLVILNSLEEREKLFFAKEPDKDKSKRNREAVHIHVIKIGGTGNIRVFIQDNLRINEKYENPNKRKITKEFIRYAVLLTPNDGKNLNYLTDKEAEEVKNALDLVPKE
ncbi:6285_t:CDS:2 [Entrophospora sp. SA101]|nr:6285_t:CDS:2 [Entrophospora sp. SA101]